jgi:hypothetical protein
MADILTILQIQMPRFWPVSGSLQERLNSALVDSGEIDELLRSFLELMLRYVSEIRPALTHALERAQKAPLPSEVLAELMAAGAKIDADRMSMVCGSGDLDAAERGRAQAVQQAIAGVEHITDAARELTQRTQRLLEESGSRLV